MNALLLGSIGTLSDTSELQRRAFNEAFRRHGLDWSWPRDDYRRMLAEAGGQRRIRAQADAEGAQVDAAAVHATKSEVFQGYLLAGEARARPGVIETLERARTEGTKLGLVTTTTRGNVDAILRALGLDRDMFGVVTSLDDVSAPKPAPDCYHLAAETLAVAPEACTAVEDNADGVRAAKAAGCTVLAWPGENNRGHDFAGARMVGDDLTAAIWPQPMAAE